MPQDVRGDCVAGQSGRWRPAASASAERSVSSPVREAVPSAFLRSDGSSGAPGRAWSSSNWPQTSSMNQRSVGRRC